MFSRLKKRRVRVDKDDRQICRGYGLIAINTKESAQCYTTSAFL